MTSRLLRYALLAIAIGQAQAAELGTFEDIYGPSGESFQGAVGFRVYEATAATGPAGKSFGAAIDDMVVQWREYKLVEDAADCATSGSCASLALDSLQIPAPNGTIAITVVDTSPYGQASPVNDCNHDGDFADAGVDDQDCNDNGTADVVARATSEVEPAGEPVVLDRLGSTSAYRGMLPLSTVTSGPGVLLLADETPTGPFLFQVSSNLAAIRFTYADRWDGGAAGNECRASSDPAEWGIVALDADVPMTTARVTVPKYRLSDVSGSGTPPLPAGQDGDGFPDTSETVDLYLTLWNHTDQPLTNLTVQLATTDPKIDCVLSPVVFVESFPAQAIQELPAAMRFKVASSADRSGAVPPATCASGTCSNGAGACSSALQCKKTVNDAYAATLDVLLAADSFDAASDPQSLQLDLDLNSRTAAIPTSVFSEGFEAGLGGMVLLNLDDGLASNTLSDGRRCQYNDPDFVGSNSFGDTECYLGFVNGQPLANDWHLHDTSDPGAGRAYQGTRSLHYAIHTFGAPGLDTYGLSQMDAIRTKNGINLAARICRDDPSPSPRACNSAADCVGFGGGPCVSANPELSFKQQISTLDERSTHLPLGTTPDRAIVAAQLFVVGAIWQKIAPYQNVYDVKGTDNFTNCLFDPIDDGNTEDDYFEPTDPDRRFGPSSTCFPEFAFSYLGDTDEAFQAAEIGRASDGPGLQGSLGIGTWVESKFDLSRFRGRQIRLRWLFTSIKVSDRPHIEDLFHWNPNAGDDGWYVDDIRVTQTLGASVPTVTLDTIDHSTLPGCGVACSTLDAVLTSTPASTPSPGQAILLSTVGSSADRCVNGTLLTEFWIDGDGDGSLDDSADVLVRPYSVDPFYRDAPRFPTRYAARVRCSSAPGACTDTAFVTVPVACPGNLGTYEPGMWWNGLRFTNKTTLVIPDANQVFDFARGSIQALRATGSFGGEVCLANEATTPTLVDASVPAVGGGYYYLLRGTDAACNENRSWRTFSPKENPSDPARRDNQIGVCTP